MPSSIVPSIKFRDAAKYAQRLIRLMVVLIYRKWERLSSLTVVVVAMEELFMEESLKEIASKELEVKFSAREKKEKKIRNE